MSLIDVRTLRILLTILLFVLCLGFIYMAQKPLIAFLFAIFFAYVLEPFVPRVSALLHISRGRSIAFIYIVLAIIVGIVFFIFGPRIVDEGQKLAASLPGFTAKVSSGQIAQELGAQRGWSAHTREQIQQFLTSHRGEIQMYEREFAGNVAQLAANSWWLVLIPILAVFFLKDGQKFGESTIELFASPRQREFVNNLLKDIHQVLAEFIRAQITLTGIALVVYTIGLWVMGVPYAFALGAVAGVLEFIPMLGPLTAAVAIVAVCILSGYSHVLVVIVFLGAWRVVQDYTIAPRVMGEKVELHPLLVIAGVLFGGEIGGVVGVYLSIPIMASIRVLWRRWRLYQGIRSLAPTPQQTAALETTPPAVEPHAERPGTSAALVGSTTVSTKP